jgi:hypothetical protein
MIRPHCDDGYKQGSNEGGREVCQSEKIF